ncbi:hypothetical protein [Dactylosporangium matsuzakiense]|uniref:Uncharacterized protein n=1 Tax=Dactylosporangium matsuzakiense TaxID=53360 RepID=A0A9W6NQX4_9ACTN|nr:hypothetical protein [Dactylosporangium matsuzakiense]UWZ41315.1 hypothetical protein Dmats_26965 [Dactylosporangium matsuzakiense]GLL05696.1 hypothetical protein GCM10017581_074430 [Dactylosporangium matsuzakiense]
MTSNRGPAGMVLIGSAELAIGGALLAAALFDLAPAAGPGRFAVPPQRTATMQPGGVIPVRVDPHDSTTMAADWDRLPA